MIMNDIPSNINGLPDLVSLQKKVYPLIATEIVSVQTTTQPIATAWGFKRILDTDDSSGWTRYKFRFDRWNSELESNKLKTDITVELIQDMASNGLPQGVITASLADQIADDINKDLFSKLKAISTVGDNYTIDSGTTDKYVVGRNVYGIIHNEIAKLETSTGLQGNYVLCGQPVLTALLGSGWVYKEDETDTFFRTRTGIKVINDKYSTDPYFVVGVKKRLGDIELSSLVFSPFDFNASGAFSYVLEALDPNSLQPAIGVLSRYAVTTAPLEDNATQNAFMVMDWDNITDEMKTKLSTIHTVSLP